MASDRRKRLNISTHGAVTAQTLVSGKNIKYHITDIHLIASQAATVTIYGGGNNESEILYKKSTTGDGDISLFLVDLFAKPGNIKITVGPG